jgi:hypothetical protein
LPEIGRSAALPVYVKRDLQQWTQEHGKYGIRIVCIFNCRCIKGLTLSGVRDADLIKMNRFIGSCWIVAADFVVSDFVDV